MNQPRYSFPSNFIILASKQQIQIHSYHLLRHSSYFWLSGSQAGFISANISFLIYASYLAVLLLFNFTHVYTQSNIHVFITSLFWFWIEMEWFRFLGSWITFLEIHALGMRNGLLSFVWIGTMQWSSYIEPHLILGKSSLWYVNITNRKACLSHCPIHGAIERHFFRCSVSIWKSTHGKTDSFATTPSLCWEETVVMLSYQMRTLESFTSRCQEAVIYI